MPSKPIARPAKPVSITEGFNKINALINRTPPITVMAMVMDF